MKNKTIYVPLAVDILHSAHINILKKAKKYGKVIVGLLTDSAIAEYKKFPLINYKERYRTLEGIKYIDQIVEQKNWDYSENIKKYKPNFFIHGDDWKTGIQKKQRRKVINTLKKIKGKLIEVPFSKNISSTVIKHKMTNIISLPQNRVSRLKRLMNSNDIVRILESHNSLTGLIIDKINIVKNNKTIEFDGMWSSSLTDSATKGLPDNSSLSFSARISSLNDIMDVTTKPLVFDADNGGQIEHLPFLVRSLERSGVSAIIMEDKVGLKKNSLFKNQTGTKQDKPQLFANKIKKICNSRQSQDFMVIARIESFIVGKGLKDALYRG
jgi:phosphoenolpyruvate phosphomutase